MLRHKLLLLIILSALRVNAWAAAHGLKPKKGKFKDVELSFALSPEGSEVRLREYAVIIEKEWLTIRKGGSTLLRSSRKGEAKQAVIRAHGGVIEVLLDGHFEASAVDPQPGAAAGALSGPEDMKVRELGPGVKSLKVQAPDRPVSGKVTLRADRPGVRFHVDGAPIRGDVWDTVASGNGPHVVTAVLNGETSPGVLFTVENDVQPPQILDLMISGADISWRTDEPATCVLELDGSNVSVDEKASSAKLPPLAPETEHTYRLVCKDENGNAADLGEQPFTTPPAAEQTAALPEAQAEAAAAVPLSAGEIKAPQKFLTPALADGVNDQAVFGPKAKDVSIIDVRGRLIVRRSRGAVALSWDGRNEQGAVVDSGVYIAKITADDGTTHYQSFAIAK